MVNDAGQPHLVPVEYLPGSEIAITPEVLIGYSLARFEFRDVALSDWLEKR